MSLNIKVKKHLLEVDLNLRKIIQKEINSNPLPKINPLIFKKTSTEKSTLATLKKEVENKKFTRSAKLSII